MNTIELMRWDLRHKLAEAERFEKAKCLDYADMALRHACRVEAEINARKCRACDGDGYRGPFGLVCDHCNGNGEQLD